MDSTIFIKIEGVIYAIDKADFASILHTLQKAHPTLTKNAIRDRYRRSRNSWVAGGRHKW